MCAETKPETETDPLLKREARLLEVSAYCIVPQAYPADARQTTAR